MDRATQDIKKMCDDGDGKFLHDDERAICDFGDVKVGWRNKQTRPELMLKVETNDVTVDARGDGGESWYIDRNNELNMGNLNTSVQID